MSTRKILILAANPDKTSPSRLEREVREIENGLERSQRRDQFEVVQRWAIRPRDVQRAMLDIEPQIVHFSGYSVGESGLIFEDDAGQPSLTSEKALAELFQLFADKLECVLLNGCYSEAQAEEIARHISYVVGAERMISDPAAIEFAVGFYDALGVGRSIEFAYKVGCSAIKLAGISEEITYILHRNGASAPSRVSVSNDLESETLDEHFDSLIKAIFKGRIVPFLGSDVNLCDRFIPGKRLEPWAPGCEYPPSGRELAAYLAQTFPPEPEKIIGALYEQEVGVNACELPEESPLINQIIHEHTILIRSQGKNEGSLHIGGGFLQYLSQYAYLTQEDELYDQLQSLELGSQPNQLHRFFAKLPSIMREKGYYPPYPLFVTTNYDCALEKAFDDAGEPFDLVFYSNALSPREQDRFIHRTPGGKLHEIREPNKYKDLSFEERPVILKLYGTADQISEGESLVITEEHYIEYLVTSEISSLLPAKLLSKLRTKRTNILFLGYLLGNWNQRIILHRIWKNLGLKKRDKWWAIQSKTRPLAQKLWQSYDVVVHDLPLKDYIAELDRRVNDIPDKAS